MPGCSGKRWSGEPTNSDGLYPDALLEMCIVGVIGILAFQHCLTTQGVDKSRSPFWTESAMLSASSMSNVPHVCIPVPDAPQTIRQNWIPFFTFFFLRILI